MTPTRDTRHRGGGILVCNWSEHPNADLWLAAGDDYMVTCTQVCRVRQRTLDTDGDIPGPLIGRNTPILASDWLAVITGQCIAMCCQNMSQLRSHLCLVFIWTKWLDLNQMGEVDVIMYGIPLSPHIPSLHHGIQFACELWGNFHTDTGLRVETAPGAVLWLHLNAVISLYAAHYRRQVWSTLTLSLNFVFKVLLINC